jgi:Subtilase family
MCDTISGELLVSYNKEDSAAAALLDQIREGKISHISFVETLSERLTKLALGIRTGLSLEFCRLRVPAGDETFKIGYLQFYYKIEVLRALDDHRLDPKQHANVLFHSSNHFQVAPNSLLSAASFSFSEPRHQNYKSLFGWSGKSTSTRRILIVDSGVDLLNSFNVRDHRNFVDHTKSKDVTDDHPSEHGTAIAEIIRDLCPRTELIIYKVLDSRDRASEWDTLAALAAHNQAEIINLSLAFGLAPKGSCPTCGRGSHESRSAVFENMIDQLSCLPDSPIIVAAAGNGGANQLSFPARFGEVVAIESVNQRLELSQFTNRSSISHQGDPHQNVFVLPGGEKGAIGNVAEYIGTSTKGTQHCGTSFSAAYASGIIAHLWDEPAHKAKDRSQLLAWLRQSADKRMVHSNPSVPYGNGLMRVSRDLTPPCEYNQSPWDPKETLYRGESNAGVPWNDLPLETRQLVLIASTSNLADFQRFTEIALFALLEEFELREQNSSFKAAARLFPYAAIRFHDLQRGGNLPPMKN